MLLALVILPLLFAGLAFAIPSARVRPWLVPIGAAVNATLTVLALTRPRPSALGGWVVLDPLGKLVLAFLSLLYLLCALYAPAYLAVRPQRRNRIFCAALLAFFFTRGGGGVKAEPGADTLVRIDPRTNKVAVTIPLPEGAQGGLLAIGDGSIWMENFVGVYRVDPGTNAITGELTVSHPGRCGVSTFLDFPCVGPITTARGFLWAYDSIGRRLLRAADRG